MRYDSLWRNKFFNYRKSNNRGGTSLKIYEGTDGLRGLVRKLIEVYNFKKVVYEDDNASIDTQDAVVQLWVTDELFLRCRFADTSSDFGWCDLRTEALTCSCISGPDYASDERRWIIYKQSDLVAIGIDNNTASRPDINIIIGEITNYETGETEIGMTTSRANNNTNLYSVFTNGTSIKSTPYRYFCQQKSVTSLTPVVSTELNKGFTNVYHILSHTQGIPDNSNNNNYTVPTQTILLNNKKYLLSRFAFEIKD